MHEYGGDSAVGRFYFTFKAFILYWHQEPTSMMWRSIPAVCKSRRTKNSRSIFSTEDLIYVFKISADIFEQGFEAVAYAPILNSDHGVTGMLFRYG